MSALDYPDDTLRQLLESARVIAVVGASPNPARDSHDVMAFLQSRGYRCIPVNPRSREPEILGEKVYPALADAYSIAFWYISRARASSPCLR